MVKENSVTVPTYTCEVCGITYGDVPFSYSFPTDPKLNVSSLKYFSELAKKTAEKCEKLTYDDFKFNIGERVVLRDLGQISIVKNSYRLPNFELEKHFNLYDVVFGSSFVGSIEEQFLRSATEEDYKETKVVA